MPLPKKRVSPGGIVIPEPGNDDEKQWEVLSIGPGYLQKNGAYLPLEVKPGERVLTRNVRGWEVMLEDGSIIIHASEILMSWPSPVQ